MAIMTEKETWDLAEQVEKNPPKVSGDGKSGFFIKHKSSIVEGKIVILDDVSAAWLNAASLAVDKTPSELITEMVREKMALTQ